MLEGFGRRSQPNQILALGKTQATASSGGMDVSYSKSSLTLLTTWSVQSGPFGM